MVEKETDQEFLSGLKFLRHVDSRWLTLLPAVKRIHQQLPALKRYFKDFLPKKDKKRDTSARFQRIYKILTEEFTKLEVELHFLENIKPLFDKYLTLLQTEGPMIHKLYPLLTEFMKTFLGRFIKQEKIPSTGNEVLSVDTSSKNQLSDKDLVVGVSTMSCLDKIKSDKKKLLLLAMRSFFVTTADYLKARLPLDNAILKAAVICNPEERKKSEVAVGMVRILCQALPCCSDLESSIVLDEWNLYVEDNIPEWKKLPVDAYWTKIQILQNICGKPKYNTLVQLMMCTLTLPHSNADTERSLSRNNKVLTKERVLLSIKTLIGIRLVQDAVKTLGDGDPCQVHIIPEMIKLCKGAYTMYDLEMKEKKEKESREKKAKEIKEKGERKKKEDEKKRQDAVNSIREKNKKLDEEIKEIESNFLEAENLAKESSARMEKAVKNKDMSGITIAHELQEVARKRNKRARTKMEELNDRKRKLTSELEKYAKKKRV